MVGSVIFTMISRCAWMNEDVWVDIVTGLLGGIALLLSTDAYELLGAGVDWIALAMQFVSCMTAVAALAASAASLVTKFVSCVSSVACCVAIATCCAVFATVFTSPWIAVRASMTLVKSRVFSSFLIRPNVEVMMVLTKGIGTGCSFAASIHSSASLR